MLTTFELPQTYINVRYRIRLKRGGKLAFIKLNKKSIKKDSTNKDEVPDELPSLVNELMSDNGDANSESEVPDELPSLEPVNPSAEEQEKPADNLANIEWSEEESSKPAVQAEQSVFKTLKTEPDKTGSVITPVINEFINESPKKPGFFSDIASKLREGKKQDNFVVGMKKYWKKHEFIEREIKTSVQKELESDFDIKIIELQDLEKRWIEFRRELENVTYTMKNLEAEIALKSEELKSVSNKIENIKTLHKRINNPNVKKKIRKKRTNQ